MHLIEVSTWITGASGFLRKIGLIWSLMSIVVQPGNEETLTSADFKIFCPWSFFKIESLTINTSFFFANWFVVSFLTLSEVRLALSVQYLEFEVRERLAHGILFLPSSLASLFGVTLMKLPWTSLPRGSNLLRVLVLSLGIVCWLRLIFIPFAAWKFSTRDQRSSVFSGRLWHSFFSWTMIFNVSLKSSYL